MNIYLINRQIEELLEEVDPETGEALFDPALLNELMMEREAATEDLALGYKNLTAEAAAIRGEAAALTERARKVEKMAENAKKYLTAILGGEKFKTSRVSIGYRTSSRVDLGDGFIPWAKENAPRLLREKEPEADKSEIKRLLKNGVTVPYASLIEESNIQIR